MIIRALHLVQSYFSFLRNMKTYVYLCLLIVGVVSACRISFEKRRYNKGYHVEISRKYKNAGNQSTAAVDKDKSASGSVTETVLSTDSKQTDKKLETSVSENLVTTTGSQPEDGIQGMKNPPKLVLPVEKSTKNSSHQPVELLSSKHASSSEKKSKTSNSFWFYLLPGLTVAGAFGGLVANKKRTWNLAKWASKNPKKSRYMIGAGHLTIGTLGYGIGYELYQLGFVSSSYAPLIFSGTLVGSAGLLFFEERRTKMQVWQSYFKRKFLHLMIAGSFLGSMISVGNSVKQQVPQSTPIGMLAATIHQQIHTDRSTNEITADAQSEGKPGLIVLYVLLILVVLILTVAAACALSCNGSTVGAVMVSVLGLILIGLLISKIAQEARKIKASKGNNLQL